MTNYVIYSRKYGFDIVDLQGEDQCNAYCEANGYILLDPIRDMDKRVVRLVQKITSNMCNKCGKNPMTIYGLCNNCVGDLNAQTFIEV